MQFVSKKNWWKKTTWHNWFAWYPVASYHTIHAKTWLWLEVTRRRAVDATGSNGSYWFYEYNTK